MTWTQARLYAKEKNGSLYHVDEVRKILAFRASKSYYDAEFFKTKKYDDFVPFAKEDAWLAVVAGSKKSGFKRDWIQVGHSHHHLGKSHLECCGYPDWGDNEDKSTFDANISLVGIFKKETKLPGIMADKQLEALYKKVKEDLLKSGELKDDKSQ